MAGKRKRQPGEPFKLAAPRRLGEEQRLRAMRGPGGMRGGPIMVVDAPLVRPFGNPPPEERDRRANEKSTLDLHRLLEQKEFADIDEANAFIQQFMGRGARQIPAAEPRTPAEAAQQKMYEAFAASGKQRLELAREALRISPDCADAYVLLAEEGASTAEEALGLYEQGVAAGERALGPEMFEGDNVGRFWGIVETRPYMRARAGLARTLWYLGRRDEAIAQWQELLRLNRTDNQGNRHHLLSALLTEGRTDEARRLLSENAGEASAWWPYSEVLVALREEGPHRRAKRRLAQALEVNPYVPGYLLGRVPLPEANPPYIRPGEEDEAAAYVHDALPAWHATEGALEFLASHAAE